MVREILSDKVVLEQLEDTEKVTYAYICKKSIPGNSKCKGPEACDCQACVKNGEGDSDVETQ